MKCMSLFTDNLSFLQSFEILFVSGLYPDLLHGAPNAVSSNKTEDFKFQIFCFISFYFV